MKGGDKLMNKKMLKFLIIIVCILILGLVSQRVSADPIKTIIIDNATGNFSNNGYTAAPDPLDPPIWHSTFHINGTDSDAMLIDTAGGWTTGSVGISLKTDTMSSHVSVADPTVLTYGDGGVAEFGQLDLQILESGAWRTVTWASLLSFKLTANIKTNYVHAEGSFKINLMEDYDGDPETFDPKLNFGVEGGFGTANVCNFTGDYYFADPFVGWENVPNFTTTSNVTLTATTTGGSNSVPESISALLFASLMMTVGAFFVKESIS